MRQALEVLNFKKYIVKMEDLSFLNLVSIHTGTVTWDTYFLEDRVYGRLRIDSNGNMTYSK
jgi:hypothetical protein